MSRVWAGLLSEKLGVGEAGGLAVRGTRRLDPVVLPPLGGCEAALGSLLPKEARDRSQGCTSFKARTL